MNADDLRDLLDGEGAVIDTDGLTACYDHQIFLNDLGIECGYPVENMNRLHIHQDRGNSRLGITKRWLPLNVMI